MQFTFTIETDFPSSRILPPLKNHRPQMKDAALQGNCGTELRLSLTKNCKIHICQLGYIIHDSSIHIRHPLYWILETTIKLVLQILDFPLICQRMPDFWFKRVLVVSSYKHQDILYAMSPWVCMHVHMCVHMCVCVYVPLCTRRYFSTPHFMSNGNLFYSDIWMALVWQIDTQQILAASVWLGRRNGMPWFC